MQRQWLFSSPFRRSRRIGSVLAVAAALLLSPEGVFTQVAPAAGGKTPAQAANISGGSVLGTVTDNHGAAIAGATVILRNVENGTEQQAQSSPSGDYEFPAVHTGSYIVTVKAEGFSTGDSEPFAIAENVHQRVDMPLEVKGSTETVEVNASAANLQSDTSDRNQVMEQTEIQSLPLNSREYTDLTLLNPGASYSALQDDPIEPRRGSFHINGMRSSVNNFLLDGLDNNSYQKSNLGYNNQTITPSQDAIQELKIVTSNFPAEYGRSGGSIINTVTRSGTDRIRFSGWEYYRDTAMAAYGPLYETGHKPEITQHQFGGTLGGPILRDKLFFFLNYEGYRVYNNAYYISTLPNAQQRQGIFMGATGLPITITNPYTGVTYPDGRIPQADLAQNPFAQYIVPLLPALTNDSEYYNYVAQAKGQNTRDLAEFRLDWSPGPRVRTFARYSQQLNHILPAAAIPGPAGGYGDGHINSVTNQVSLGLTYTLSPTALLDFRFGVTRVASGKLPYNYGQPSIFNTLGIPYPVAPQVGTTSLNTQSIGDISTLGTESQTNIYQDPFTVDPKINYSIDKSRHAFGFGYEYLFLKIPTAWQSPVYGYDIYNDHFSRTIAAPTGQIADYQDYYFADFLYGARAQYELSNYSRLTQNMRFHYWYAEDNWRILPKLTLNYGLRYELTIPDFESQNHLANFDPKTNSLKMAQPGSYASRSLVNVQKTNFAPRFGLAYSMLPKVVWRAGYGMSYIQFNRTPDMALEYNGPFSITTIIQQASPQNNVCAPGSESYECFRPTYQGYPTSMNSGIAFSTSDSESYYTPPDSPTGYDQSYYFGFQYQPDKHSILDVAYVGSHGVHVQVLADYNQAPPASVANLGTLPQRRPIQTFADIWTTLPAGFLRYNSLQVRYQERWNRFFLINSFTWSQARDNASGDQETGNGDAAVVNFFNIKGDAGISGYNQPLNLSTSVNWNLPRTGFNSRLLRGALNDWRVNVLDHLTSGLPLNLTWGPSVTDYTTNIGYHYRANVPSAFKNAQAMLNPKSQWLRRGGGQYVGNVFKACPTDPVSGLNLCEPLNSLPATGLLPGQTVIYGNSPRNSIRFVPIWNMDASVFKDFRIADRGILQFRAEAFNAPNKTNWRAPNTSVSSASFGYIGSAQPSRQFQLAVRYSY